MRTLATAALFTFLAFGQGEDKTFYFTQPVSIAEVTSMATMTRTLMDLQDISVDQEHQAVVMHGPVDKLVASDWLLHQLDQPGAASGSSTAGEYKISGEVIKLFCVSPAATVADITALTTAIRTTADLQRLFPLAGQKVIVGRGTPEKMAATEWMVGQLLPPETQAPTTDSVAYPSPLLDSRTEADKPVIRIFRMDPKTTNAELTSAVTAIRTIADIQRLFPFENGEAKEKLRKNSQYL
jgi:hypothetical protein